MTSYCVKLKGASKIIEIEAASFEEESNLLEGEENFVAKDGTGKVTAKFNRREVAGWWIDQGSVDLAEEIKQARERASKKGTA